MFGTSPAAQAESGQLAAFGAIGMGPGQFFYGGPSAVDPSDGDSVYVSDFTASVHPRIRKFAPDGTLLATVEPDTTGLVPGAGPAFIYAIAVDGSEDRLYALIGAEGAEPASPGQFATAGILAYSTTPNGSGALVPAAGASPAAVIHDFRADGGFVYYPTGIAVDPGTHKIVVLGVNDPSTGLPGVLQYFEDDGELSTRVNGLGNGIDAGTIYADRPAGLAIAPDGGVFIPRPGGEIYRVPREGGTPVLAAQDKTSNFPIIGEGVQSGVGVGSPIGISADGSTVYIAEYDGATARIRGFSTVDGSQSAVFGGGTTSCKIPIPNSQLGIAGGANGQLVVTSPGLSEGDPTTEFAVHVFGPGGTGCPHPSAAFKVNSKTEDPITVIKGQAVAFDAGGSQLQGLVPTQVDWDFDGSGLFATHVVGTPPALTTTNKFVALGTFKVGVRIELENAPTTEPVYREVKVVAPTPSAVLKVSNRNPAAGESVSFDAGDSIDPAGSPTAGPAHELAAYRWDFGDGQTVETTTATVSHAFANTGTAALSRTVKLVVVSKDGVSSNPVQQTVTVAGTAGAGGGAPAPSPGPSQPSTPPAASKPKPKLVKCKKGTVKKHGKCVKAKKHKRGRGTHR